VAKDDKLEQRIRKELAREAAKVQVSKDGLKKIQDKIDKKKGK
jgi:hypothetical protein